MSGDQENAKLGADRWHDMILNILPEEEKKNLFMPQEAYMNKINDTWRYSLLIKCPIGKRRSYSAMLAKVKEAEKKNKKKEYIAVIDINPYSFN